MFNQRELQVINESLDTLRLELLKIYSASKIGDMGTCRVKNELEEVVQLKKKVESAMVWGVAEDLVSNPYMKNI
jgi:hypothetical protein